MIVRVTTLRYDRANEAAIVRLTDELVAALRGVPGCQGATAGIDRDTGREVIVTTWASLAEAEGMRDALGAVRDRLLAAGIRLDPPQHYEQLA